MTAETIDHGTLSRLVEAGAVRGAHIVGQRGGWAVLVKYGMTERPLAAQRGGALWCVFGCGGDRDPLKRPLMAQVAELGADRVVLTSDNPRSESPAAILAQVRAGLHQPLAAEQIEDRAAAIRHTLLQAADADVVLVAGKGHETTQEIAGVFHPFSDVAQIQAALAARLGQEARA